MDIKDDTSEVLDAEPEIIDNKNSMGIIVFLLIAVLVFAGGVLSSFHAEVAPTPVTKGAVTDKGPKDKAADKLNPTSPPVTNVENKVTAPNEIVPAEVKEQVSEDANKDASKDAGKDSGKDASKDATEDAGKETH